MPKKLEFLPPSSFFGIRVSRKVLKYNRYKIFSIKAPWREKNPPPHPFTYEDGVNSEFRKNLELTC